LIKGNEETKMILYFRLPKYILQKRCLCRHCIMLSKTSGDLVEHNPIYDSVNITLTVPVLYWDSRTYNKVLEDVVVGCTCVFPRYTPTLWKFL